MNLELPFLDDLEAALSNLTLSYSDGGSERFTAVGQGKVPPSVGYPCAAIIPLGPNFPVEVLGIQGLDRRTKNVGALIEIHYEHPDQRQGLRNMSDILWQVIDRLTDPSFRPGGCESFTLGDTDYAFAVADAEKDLQVDWGYKAVAVIPVVGTWRYRK